MQNCGFFEWVEKDEGDPREEKKSKNTCNAHSTCSSEVGQECMMIKCREEKKKMEVQIKQLKEKKSLLKCQLLNVNAELEKLKTSHVSKFVEIESRVLIVGCLFVVVFMSLLGKYM